MATAVSAMMAFLGCYEFSVNAVLCLDFAQLVNVAGHNVWWLKVWMDLVWRWYIDCCWQVYVVASSGTHLALSHFQLHFLHCDWLVAQKGKSTLNWCFVLSTSCWTCAVASVCFLLAVLPWSRCGCRRCRR